MPNLGAADIGGYMDFIQQMLGLRNQRLEEEKAKAALKQEQMQSMMKMASQASGQIGNALVGYAQQGQQNQLGNTLGSEYYGSKFTGGGMPELEMRMKMADLQSRMGNRAENQDLAAERLNLASGNYDLRVAEGQRQAEAAQRTAENSAIAQRRGQYDDAMQAWKASSEDWQSTVKDVSAYNKELGLAVGDATKAKDMETYNAAVSHINTLHQAAKNQGFKDLTLPPIPPSPDQRDAITAAQSTLGTLAKEREEKMGDWTPNVFQKIPTAEEVLQKQKEMQALPGYGYEPGNIPSTALRQNPPEVGPAPTLQQFGLPTGAPAPGASAAGSAPQRQQFRNKQTGQMEWFEYRNGQWVPVK